MSLFDRFWLCLIEASINTASHEGISRLLIFRLLLKKLINFLNISFLSIHIVLTLNINKSFILWWNILINTQWMLIWYKSIIFWRYYHWWTLYFFHISLYLKLTCFKISLTFYWTLNHIESHFYNYLWNVNTIFRDLDS